MPYTRKELFEALDIDPGTPAETPDVEKLLHVLLERAGEFAADYQKRPYMRKLHKVFGKEFDEKVKAATKRTFAKMRKNKEWAFIFMTLGEDCPPVIRVYMQMLWSARTLNLVFEQLLKEAERS